MMLVLELPLDNAKILGQAMPKMTVVGDLVHRVELEEELVVLEVHHYQNKDH